LPFSPDIPRAPAPGGFAVPDRASRLWLVLDPLHASTRIWAASFAMCVVLVAASYAWVDQPLATVLHGKLPSGFIFRLGAHLPDVMLPAAVALAVLLPAFFLSGLRRRLGPALLLCGGAYVISSAVKWALKLSFGRTWPETWVHNNPSFLRDGVYGFAPFHGGAGWTAFPSGHMTVTMALAVVAWQLWPWARPLTVLAVLAMECLLVGMNFHWLSDTIAGAWVGTACGVLTLKLARDRFGVLP